MRKIVALAVLAVLAGCEKEDQGPWPGMFGTKAGITVAQLQKHVVLQKKGDTDANGQDLYESPQAPNMSANADKYSYVFGKEAGLCLVSASYDSPQTGNSKVVDELIAKYGKPEKDEAVENGVIWSADKYKLDEGLKSVRILFIGNQNPSARVTAIYHDNDCR